MTALPPGHTDFWNDETAGLNDKRLKKQIPELPLIEDTFQTVKGRGIETLAYLALQVQKSSEKRTLIRAIASACSCLLNDSSNYTGAKDACVDLTGLDRAADPQANPTEVLKTNFEDAEEVTIAELLDLMEADNDEIGAYFGVLFLAGNKKLSTENRTAFNEKRRNAALASVTRPAKIFINDSLFLTDEILTYIYGTFLSYSPIRAQMTSRVVSKLSAAHMGPSLAFVNMFLLLVDSDMSALRMIKEAVLKYPWIREEFPELRVEFNEANNGFQIIKKAPGNLRSFLKAIHGNNFVPVNYQEIDNLTGVCKTVLKRTTPSYQNYRGGKITEAQEQKIITKLGISHELTTAVAAE
uniref:RNA-dependent RNA polymerase n=1 Tax=Grapevine-associated negative single-stranded RNA virus 1 TaxID=2814398 RepID=A0A8F5MLE0_9VIRU|nr:MAG: RNA-dependent RNA polymerase [Grapevine-associated negative single-stranded RNA virus 1]